MSGLPSKAALLRRFRRALAAAGRDTAHVFYDLRHTFGTRTSFGLVRLLGVAVQRGCWVREAVVS